MDKSFLEEIKKEVAITLTVDMPDLLDKLKIKNSARGYVMDLLSEAFKLLCQGLDDNYMDSYELLISSDTIFSIMEQISEVVVEENFLSIWLFFGSSIENWIETCVDYEEYESATNLKKILERD